jgi:hypothetical protein
MRYDHRDHRPAQLTDVADDPDPLDDLLAHLAAYPDERVREWARRLARGDDREMPEYARAPEGGGTK